MTPISFFCRGLMSVGILVLSTHSALADLTISDEIVPEFQALDAQDQIVVEMLEPDAVNNVGQTLINGTPVNPRDFPGVLRMVTGGTCTAALVGPSTVLFAAHCLLGNTRITFRAGTRSVRGICEPAPSYDRVKHNHDWALCLLSNKVTGIVYETVDIKTRPAVGDRLMLSGFGCTQQGGDLDNRLRVGFAPVVRQPRNLAVEPSALFTGASVGAGEAVLCPGDSGGPLFRSGANATEARQIVGLNSRTTFALGISIFSATAAPQGAAFIKEWATRNNQAICGVNRVAGCK